MSTPENPRPQGEPEPDENPTDEELDVEGPNESAPGHAPAGGEVDEQDTPAGSQPRG